MIKTLIVSAALACCLQAQAATVAFQPPTRDVLMGESFTMTVMGSSFATNLDGGGLDLRFDPAVLEVTDVLIDGVAWDFAPDKGVIDNVAGSVTGTSFNQFAHPKVGTFEILQYRFTAKGTVSSVLQLSEYVGNPFASGGAVVPVTFSDGLVTVSAVPEPSTAALLLAGLVVGTWLRIRR